MSDMTMQKIADLAGVSRITVSRVLTDPAKVRPETRAMIRAIMDESGYTYHAGAAELIRRKTSIIGLIMPSSISPAFNSTILAAQEAAIDLGMSLLLGCAEYDAEKEEALLRQFMARRVAGVIMMGNAMQNEDLILRLQAGGIPCVIIWTSPRNPNLCEVGFDNEKAAAGAVRHLIDLGHKRIAMISGPLGRVRRVEDRVAGYRNAMREGGLAVDSAYLRSGEPTIAVGEREALALLALDTRPTAIFAASDMLAIGALGAARKMGLRVPGDLSVVGFDNIEFSAHTCPQLTTVSVPEKEMSRLAITMIKRLIHGEITSPQSCCLETELVVRQSSGAPE